MLKKNREKTGPVPEGDAAAKKKPLKWWQLVLLALAAVLLIGLAFFLWLSRYMNSRLEGASTAVSAEVSAGDVSRTLSGAGTLAAEDAVSVTVPGNVKLTSVAVEAGDSVSAGDALATVDHDSVVLAIAELQNALDELDEYLNAADGETLESAVTARAAGRVKAVYAQAGDGVSDVVEEHGALMLLSLDGLMAVDLPAGDLESGQAVAVTLSDGTTLDGRVQSVVSGTAVVTLSDESAPLGDEVAVADENGAALGGGALYIHSELKITGFSGTVSAVHVAENSLVSAGGTVLTLTDTAYTGEYDKLLEKRGELEQRMLELFVLYQDNTIRAEFDGIVSSAAELDDGSYALSYSGSGAGNAALLAANPPDADPSLVYDPAWVDQAAVVTAVSYGSLTLQYYFGSVPDYAAALDLSGFTAAPGTVSLSPSCAVFVSGESGWSLSSLGSLSAGDVLILTFADSDGDGIYTDGTDTLEWIVLNQHTQSGSQPSGSGGTDAAADQTGGAVSAGGAASAGTTAETEFSYELTETEVAALTPVETMTVNITVDELDILSVQTGQEALVTLDAFQGRSFAGTVTSIDTAGTNSGGSTKYTAEVTLAREDGMLPGMNAGVVITLSTDRNVLTVPVAALQENGTQVYVYTGYDEKTETFSAPVAVTVGQSDGTNAEVLSGLAAGDTVWYTYKKTADLTAGFITSGSSFSLRSLLGGGGGGNRP